MRSDTFHTRIEIFIRAYSRLLKGRCHSICTSLFLPKTQVSGICVPLPFLPQKLSPSYPLQIISLSQSATKPVH